MQKAHLNLIKFLLKNEMSADVETYDRFPLCRDSKNYNKIKDAIESVDDSLLYIIDKEGREIGRAWIGLDYDQQPDEIVRDFTTTDFMMRWEKEYYGE